MNSKIHIGLSTDDNYVDFTTVVINSIIHYHSPRGLELSFHIFTNGLSPSKKNQFNFFLDKGVEIQEHVINTEEFAKRWAGKNNPMYYRLEYAERLPQISRIIYLDSDLVILDDIEKLWNSDLNGHPLGAIGDRAGLQEKRKCYAPHGNMFNSGVMVLDLALWRATNLTEQLCKFWNENISWMKFADQGLLNACLADNYECLPQKWNIITSVYRNPVIPGMYTDTEVVNALRNPGIVHFTGHHKPWLFFKSFHHPYGYTFCHTALHSPINFWLKLKLWMKLHTRRRFVDSYKQRPWSTKDLKNIRW